MNKTNKTINESPVKRHHVIEFRYAFQGLLYALRTQPNFVVHSLAAFAVLFAAYVYGLTTIETVIIITFISLVMMAELLNTALETTIDLVTQEYHPKAKAAKDLAAAGVFVMSFGAFIAGLLIFLPYLR